MTTASVRQKFIRSYTLSLKAIQALDDLGEAYESKLSPIVEKLILKEHVRLLRRGVISKNRK